MPEEAMERSGAEIDLVSLPADIWRARWTIVLLTALVVTAGG